MALHYLAEASEGNNSFPSQNSLEQGEAGLERFSAHGGGISWECGDIAAPALAEGPELCQISHIDIAVWNFLSHLGT